MKKILLFLSFILLSIGVFGADVTDILTASDFAATSTTYKDFSNVSKTSNAKYAGNSAKNSNGNIQLRSKNSNSGIVSTTSGGTVKSVKITVGSGSNIVDVYGSNTAYTSASDLYGSNKGTKIGSVTTTGTITFTSNYTYVGIRSNNGAIYLSSIEITWTTELTTTYTVTYDANGGTGTMADSNSPYTSGSTVTVLGNTFTRDNYTFDRWNTAADGSGTYYSSGGTFTISNNITLFAQWKRLYSVTYVLNGGTGTTPTETPKTAGETFSLNSGTDDDIFPPDGKVFNKWKDQDNGLYNGSATYTMPAKNVTLTAQWKDTYIPPTPGANTLFHETFGNNSNSARTWNYSYSEKSGVLAVYSDIEEYTVSNVKQGKNTTGYASSGLNQSSQSEEAFIIIGPLNVEDYSGLILSYWWKAASINATYYAKLYYKIESDGIFTEVVGTGDGATTFIEKSFNLPEEAQVSTLYLKIVWRTSNTQGIIDEVNLIGTTCVDEYDIIWKNNDTIYNNGNPTTRFNPCVGIEKTPDVPDIPPVCSDEFIGWSENDITGNGNSLPINIFNTPEEFFELYKDSKNDKCFHAIFASIIDNTSHEENFTSIFTTSNWSDGNSTWIPQMGGIDFKEGQGIHITTTVNGANATTSNFYTDIDSIIVTYSTNKSAGAGSIEFSIGNSVLSQNVTREGITDGTTDRRLKFVFSPAKTGKIKITVNCTENAIYIKSITVYHNVSSYKDYISYCTDTLKSGSSWNSGTWSLGRSPQSNERAVILQSANVDIEHAKAKEVIISQNSTNNGKLTIQSNKGLEVQDTISVYDGTYKPTTHNDLILESSSTGNASLIFNNNNESQATVCLYSKSHKDNSVRQYQYIGTAMTSLNALYNYYGSWIYRWDESQRWIAVPNGGIMYAWIGYCITQEKDGGEWYATTGTLVPTDTQDIVLEVPANSNMVFANSWTAPIHIGSFSPEDFSVSDKTIYLFNTGSDPNGTGNVGESNDAPGTYVSIPIHSSPYTGDSLISSQQGFFVKTGETSGSITLRYKDLVRTNGNNSIINGQMKMPKQNREIKPNILKIYAHGSTYMDRLVILEREDFSTGFDNGWDGEKLALSTVSPSMYVINEEGGYDEVSAIPDYEGTILGFNSGGDSICTLTFKYDGTDNWYLNDILEQKSILISDENTYTLTQLNSENDIRFIISSTPYSEITTDINQINDYQSKIQKRLYNGNLYIIKNNRIFNATGILIH